MTPTNRRQYSRANLRYETDRTDAEWAVIAPLMPEPASCGRAPVWTMREVLTAIFYVLRGGIAWRMISKDWPACSTTVGDCARWRDDGLFGRITHHLVMADRERVGRSASPTAAVATAATLRPLVDLLRREVIAGSAVPHGDDTPIPVLAPGTGKTRTGRLWTYVRDERPHNGARPPAAVFFASPDRRGERPLAHLVGFSGVLVADGYAGFNGLYEKARPGGPLTEAACWAHVRRKIFDVHAATGSTLAAEALARIGALYGIECELHGKPPDARTRERQARAKPLAAALKVWAEASPTQLPGRSELAKALRYKLTRWSALTRAFDNGCITLDNNATERALRGVAVGRKNYLFAGSDLGAERAAVFYTLIGTAKLNRVDPEAYLRDLLTRIADHLAKRLTDLLPWHWTPAQPAPHAA